MKTGIAVALTIFVFACGIYGITNSGITRWISMPFMQVSGSHFEGGKGEGFGQGKGPGNGFGNGTGKGSMSILQKNNTFLQFFGIMFSCAMITYWIVIGKKKATVNG